jgi:hypothetical protein
VEPKTLGWDNSRKSFENGYENLGVVSTPLTYFLNNFWDKWTLGLEERSWWFQQKGIGVSLYSLEAIKPCNHITRYGTGLV